MARKAKDVPRIGHNSGIDPAARAQLKVLVDRIEDLDGQISGLRSDMSDIYKEAKGNGFDVKALREVIRLRRMDAEERQQREEIRDNYLIALGMLSDLPLGKAALERAGVDAA